MILDEWRKQRDIWDIADDQARRVFELIDETNRQACYVPFEVIEELIRLYPWIVPTLPGDTK